MKQSSISVSDEQKRVRRSAQDEAELVATSALATKNGKTPQLVRTPHPDISQDAWGRVRAWAVAQTHPHKETTAESNLQRQEYKVYLPKCEKVLRRRSGPSAIVRPFFSGYIFIAADDPELNWRSIEFTLGVRRLVRFGNLPALLPGAFIDALLRRERDGLIVRPHQPFEVGDRVQVMKGPFEGAIASIIKLDDCDRVTIMLSLLQRDIPNCIDQSALKLVPEK